MHIDFSWELSSHASGRTIKTSDPTFFHKKSYLLQNFNVLMFSQTWNKCIFLSQFISLQMLYLSLFFRKRANLQMAVLKISWYKGMNEVRGNRFIWELVFGKPYCWNNFKTALGLTLKTKKHGGFVSLSRSISIIKSIFSS